MTPTARWLVVAFAGLTLSGCGFVHDKKIIGPYRLVAVDIDENMGVCYGLASGDCIGRIPETVFSVGANAQFIVAKQHSAHDRSVTNYFILVIADDSELADPGKSVIGPMSEAAYTVKAQSLGLPEFTTTIAALK